MVRTRCKQGLNIWLVLFIGLGLTAVLWIKPLLAAAEADPAAESGREARPPDTSALPLTYARIITDDVPVYAHPLHERYGLDPIRSLGSGYLWISLYETIPVYYDDQGWYRINKHEYIRADYLELYQPSTFQGYFLAEHPAHPLAWVVYDVRPSLEPGQPPPPGGPHFPRYSRVTIYEEKLVGEWTWYRVDQGQWIEQRALGVVKPSPRPDGVGEGEKWIEIDLFEQTVAAYEGDRMVYASLISSGLPWWQTKQGLFRIWSKVRSAKMSGREGYPDYYYLEDVPWTMYFYESFALHGAYWHDRFGYPHSHGCVNLAPQDAKWLFDWATPSGGTANWIAATENNPGTWVWVHE